MKSTGQIHALTGVRIVAASGVFLSHLAPPAALPEGLRTFMSAGYNGVTLFFILSGFVLTWSYAGRILPIRRSSLWSFFVARFARIYPVYLFALLVSVLPYFVAGLGDRKLMLIHALALQPWSSHVERTYSFNGPAWSIGVEVFLYACFPLVIVLLAKIRNSRAVLLCVGVIAIAAVFGLAWWFLATGRSDLSWSDPQSAHRWLYRTPLARIGDFILGAVIAFLVMGSRPPKWMPPLAQLVGAVSLIVLMFNPKMLYSVWSWDAAYMIPTAMLLWGLAAGSWTLPARLLGSKPMVLLGQASFAFYLLHATVLASWPNLMPTTQGWGALAAIQFALIAFMAIGVHLYLEEPARRWLIRVLNRKPPTAERTPAPLQMTS